LQAGAIYDDRAYTNVKLMSIKLTSRLIINLDRRQQLMTILINGRQCGNFK